MGRVGRLDRRSLHSPIEHHGLVSRGTLETIRSAHRSRGSVSNQQKRAEDPSSVAPERGTYEGAYPRLLPRVRSLENVGRLAGESAPWLEPAHRARGVPAHPEHGCHSASRERRGTSAPLRRPTRRSATDAVGIPRSEAPSTTPVAHPSRPDVVPTFASCATQVVCRGHLGFANRSSWVKHI